MLFEVKPCALIMVLLSSSVTIKCMHKSNLQEKYSCLVDTMHSITKQ